MDVNKLVTRMEIAGFKQALKQYDNDMGKMIKSGQKHNLAFDKSFQSVAKKSSEAWVKSFLRINQSHQRMIGMMKNDLFGLDAAYKKSATLLKTAFVTAGTVAVAAIGGAVMAIGTQISMVGRQYEHLKANMATNLQTDKLGGKEFWRVMQFGRDKAALNTEQDLMGSYFNLKTAGLSTSNKSLEAYGNLGAGNNMNLMQATQTAASGATGNSAALGAFGVTAEAGKYADELEVTFKGVKQTIKNDAASIGRYLENLGNTAFKNGLNRQMSMTDAKIGALGLQFKFLADKIWWQGMKQAAGRFLDWAMKIAKEIEPLAMKHIPPLVKWLEKTAVALFGLAVDLFPKLVKGLIELKAIAPFILTFLLGMTLRMVGLKAIMIGGWIIQAIAALRTFYVWIRTVTFAQMLLNITMFALPMAIGAALAAIAYIGYQVYQYLTKGEKGIEGIRKQMPWLADMIVLIAERWRYVQPFVMALIAKTWELIKVVGEWLIPAMKWCFENIIVPLVILAIVTLTGFIDIIINVVNWVKSVTVESENWRSGIVSIQNAFKTMWETVKPWLDALGILLGGIGEKMAGVLSNLPSIPGFGGGDSGGSGGGSGAAGLAAAAMKFVSSGQADKYAFSGGKSNGFVTSSLFKMGIACAQTVDQLLKMSGASKEVQDAMTASAPGSYSSLKGKGLAKSVSEKDLMPGDLVFYNPGGKGIQHVGVYVGNGQIVDASNSAGKQIGTGQRVVQRKNWMQGQAQYLRINDNQFSGGGGPTINQNIVVNGTNASPQQIQKAVTNGTGKALTKAQTQNRTPTNVGAVLG